MARQLRPVRLIALTLFAAHIAYAEAPKSPTPPPATQPAPSVSATASVANLKAAPSPAAAPSAVCTPSQKPPAPSRASSTPAPSPDDLLPPMPPGKQRDLGDAHWIFENVTPEERQKFKENLERWRKLSPEKRAELREKEEARRQHMLEEINEAIDQSGLCLDRDQLQMYALRYVQERRKVEEQLHRDMDQRRKVLLEQMHQRLMAEFAPHSCPAPKPNPAPPASPAHEAASPTASPKK